MKKLLFILLLVQTQAGFTQDIHTGLIAHYMFNGNYRDTSGHGYHLTNSGVSLTTNRVGKPNEAGMFDGSSYLNASNIDDTAFSNNEITISSWIQFAANQTSDARIVAIGKSNTFWQYCIQGFIANSAQPIWYGTDGVSSYNFYQQPNLSISSNAWHHIVSTANAANDSMYMYIDGQLFSKVSISINDLKINNSTENIMLGASAGAGNYFKGNMDEVRIYKRALSEQDIMALYKNDTTALPNGIVKIDMESKIATYPNPFSNQLIIELTQPRNLLNVYSADGKKVWSVETKEQTNTRIETSTWGSGVYILEVITPEGKLSRTKLIKQ